MKKSFNQILNEWVITKKIPPDKRKVSVSINFWSPDVKEYAKLKIEDRRKYADDLLKNSLKSLTSLNLLERIELRGSKRRPLGLTGETTLIHLKKLVSLNYVKEIEITKMEGAGKRKEKIKNKKLEFFCVRMTVSIQIEGFTSGMQPYEERFVLVKAKDFESAYALVEKQEKDYGEPYLNGDLRLVKWKVESYDDCYHTLIDTPDDLNEKYGVEVYSRLGSRKLTKERAWKDQE